MELTSAEAAEIRTILLSVLDRLDAAGVTDVSILIARALDLLAETR